jgi:hypothetical protein
MEAHFRTSIARRPFGYIAADRFFPRTFEAFSIQLPFLGGRVHRESEEAALLTRSAATGVTYRLRIHSISPTKVSLLLSRARTC